MIISDIIFNMHVKFKVVHSIPGRLRIHVPSAKKIPKSWQFDQEYFELFSCIPGLTKIEFNYVTHNALITYDNKLTNDQKIIANLKEITKLAHNNKEKLASFDVSQKEEAAKWFSSIVEEHLK